MLSVIVCGDSPVVQKRFVSVKKLEMEGMPITVGLMETSEPTDDWKEHVSQSHVFIKVRAFSCNYRDKCIILQNSQLLRGSSDYTFIGSEFVGEVIAIGPQVTKFQVGDRVMADNSYSGLHIPDVQPGVPTSGSSKRYFMLHESKLTKVPPAMPNEVAAAFGLNAQTAYSMLRKLNIRAGANVLVTSARSNISLFVLNALKNQHCQVYAITSATEFEGNVLQLGIKEVLYLDPSLPSFLVHQRMREIISSIDGFDYVIDPFSDLYLSKAIAVMAMEGKYITCGFYDQYPHLTGKTLHHAENDFKEIISTAIVHNIQIIGNCLGQTEDLNQALVDYTQGKFPVVIDTVCRGEQVDTFFERTYSARDRFGKVVYCYDD